MLVLLSTSFVAPFVLYFVLFLSREVSKGTISGGPTFSLKKKTAN